MVKKLFKDIFGITRREEAERQVRLAEEAEAARIESERLEREAQEKRAALLRKLEEQRQALPTKKKKSPKDIATDLGEPYVDIVSMDVDPTSLEQGSFTLDWNDKFVANLVRAGYQMDPNDTDADIVDRWFTAVCRNVVLETWEQEQAINPTRTIRSRNLGNGRSEVS